MKRSPLKRKKPLRARSAFDTLMITGKLPSELRRKPKRKTKHARRPRAVPYMRWVKTQSCMVLVLEALVRGSFDTKPECWGPIEADHAGSKMKQGDGTRAHDATCIPMCKRHHAHRENFTGVFKSFKQADMRSFLATAIQYTQNLARSHGVEVPTC